MQDLYITDHPAFPYRKAGTMLFGLPFGGPIGQAERAARTGAETPPLWGSALQRKLKEVFLETKALEFEVFAEPLPHPDCSVTLDPKVKDALGLASARVSVASHPTSLKGAAFLGGHAQRLLEKAGARVTRYPEEPEYVVLQAGTARMGKDAKTSVATVDGEVRTVKNLFVADGSALPSVGAAPFTLTIMANALRIGARLVARGKRHEL